MNTNQEPARLPVGAFVVFGPERAPEVHLLAAGALAAFWQATKVARTENGRAQAYARTFGTGATVALPAWSPDCMAEIAETYAGPHAVAVRGLCAAVLLGRPFGGDASTSQDDDGGGEKVPRRPVKPRPSRPSAAKLPALFAGLTAT